MIAMTTPTNHTSSAAFLFHDDDGHHDDIDNDNDNDNDNDGDGDGNGNGTNEAPVPGSGPGKALASTDRSSARADHYEAQALEEERSKISTASSIEGSNILQHAESKSGHSRLSALLGPSVTSVVAPSPRHSSNNNNNNYSITGVPAHERPPVASRGGQTNLSAQQSLLSPLTEEDHHHPNDASSNSKSGNNNRYFDSDTPTSIATSVTQQHGNIGTGSGNENISHSLHPGQQGIYGGGGEDHGDDKAMTMLEHRKKPIPPPPTSRPPMFNSSSGNNKNNSSNTTSVSLITPKTAGGAGGGDGGDDDTATAFTVGTNGTHRTFAAVPGNVPSETLHTSNIRRFPSSSSLKTSGLLQQADGGASTNSNAIATITATNTANNYGNNFGMSSPSSMYRVDDAEVDKAAAWAIHLALVFFMTLVVAAVVLSLVVMANYGFVTLVLLVILVGFVGGLGWYVDQTVLSRNPKLRPIRRKLVTVVEAAKEALVEEYHLFVQDWKEHRLLLTEDPNSDDYINADDAGNTDGILQMDGSSSPSSSNQQQQQQEPKKKKSKIFKLVKPFLGLRKKISLKRRKGTPNNNNIDTSGDDKAPGTTHASYQPPSAAAAASSNNSVRNSVPSVTV